MDQVVGRLQAALASATNEVTVAAANINFDFSIVKYEAPKEFHPVGQLLSDRRKRDAEDGKSHTTARRLAVLFAGVCPKTPALVAAYGKRASDIATRATSNVSKAHFASVFSQYTGVDATSMWAAATSSPNGADGGAIHVHLLACMLASAWDAPEAISIWVEIVTGRRHEIALEIDGGGAVPFATAAAAAQAEIPRQQLAEWDASARAWLEVANSVKTKEQTQLRLILENIELSTGGEGCLTANVVGAWVRAVTVMDNLISGIPQEVTDGSAIVGLMAWHLYPEIHVFGRRNVELKMNDDLVPPGGILTLGCSPSATMPESGVTWSLSLSKLRYYGKSVQATATLQGDSSRLTVDEFRLVLVGCLLRMWNTPPAEDQRVIQVLGDLARAVLQGFLDGSAAGGPSWPKTEDLEGVREWLSSMLLLKKASEDFAGNEHEFGPFITLGRNRPQYAPQPRVDGDKRIGSRSFFGMLDSSSFLSALRGPEERIAALRRIASPLPGLQDVPAIIRYRTTDNKTRFVRLFPLSGGEDAELTLSEVGKAKRLARSSAEEPAPRSRYSGDSEELSDDDMTDIDDDYLTSFVTPSGRHFQLLFGDYDSACIFIASDTLHDVGILSFSVDDLAWALHRRMVDLNVKTLLFDAMAPWLAQFHYALSCLQSFPGPVISIRTLRQNAQNAKWATAWNRGTVAVLRSQLASFRSFETFSKLALNPWEIPVKECFSILAYFVSGCDIGQDELHDNTAGISFGNSLYVPSEVSCQPCPRLYPQRALV
jgi:hypothetical protein